MVKVVLDTNVIVAAARSDRGASYELLRRLIAGEYAIAISVPIVFEYEEILVRELVPAFLTLRDVDELIRFICEVGEKYDPVQRLRPALPDPDDDFVLELAVAASVRYVVTHNIRDFARASAIGIEAIGPMQFLRELRGNP